MSFAQGDLGSAIVLGVRSSSRSVSSPASRSSHVGRRSPASGVGCGALAIVSDPRRFNRITAFRDIEGNKEHLAWQSYQGLLSIANGGITGSGIGGSNSKMGYLPLAHSDFIFAVIADELGLVGSLAVVGGFMCSCSFGIQTALAAPDRFGLLLAGGIIAWFGVQAIVNMGGVVNLMPVTGLTLAVLLGRRHVAVRVDGAGGPAAERLAACRHRRPRTCAPDRSSGRRRATPLASVSRADRSPADRCAVRRRHRRRHGGPRAAGAGGRRGSGRQRARSAAIHYMGARAGHRDPAAARHAVPAHVLRRRRVPAQLGRASQPRQFVPKMWRARREAIDAVRARCARRSSSASAATPACRPCSPPGASACPIVVVSYDLLPGRASRLAARGAAACAVAFPDSPLPRATLTGAPVRQAVLDVDRARPRRGPARPLGLPDDRFVVAVMGGSQGSGVLNEAVAALLGRRRPTIAGLAIRHAVGERFLAARRRRHATARDGVLYQPIGYEYAHAVGVRRRRPADRAGRSEHGPRGRRHRRSRPSWCRGPASADDHQTLNVRWLSDAARRSARRARHRSSSPDVDRRGSVADRRRTLVAERRPAGCGRCIGVAHWQAWSSRSL